MSSLINVKNKILLQHGKDLDLLQISDLKGISVLCGTRATGLFLVGNKQGAFLSTGIVFYPLFRV